MTDGQPMPHHRVRRPDEIADDFGAAGVPFTHDVGERVSHALDVFASYAQHPLPAPRRFPRLRAYLAGMRAFRNLDGYGPSFSWPSPLDDSWCRGYDRAHQLTCYRFDR